MRLVLFIFPFIIVFYYLFGSWTFVNDWIDFCILILAILSFPFGYLQIFSRKRYKIIVYIISIFFILAGLLLLDDFTKVKMGFGGEWRYEQNNVIIKEDIVIYGFLDGGTIFYSFHRSKKYPWLEKMDDYIFSSDAYYLGNRAQHKVIVITPHKIAVHFLNLNSRQMETDTLYAH